MDAQPVTPKRLAASVIAVPPLCRDQGLALDPAENRRLIRHLEQGGVRTLLYGGNANLYNIAPSEYPALLDLLETEASADTLIIPSAGPFFGPMMDQAAILRDRSFPAAMILPALFPATQSGVQKAVRLFAERAGIPVVLYLKEERYLSAAAAAELFADGIVSWIKYAVVREDPAQDAYLEELCDRVDPAHIVSGIGEQPARVHTQKFRLISFTSGCVCVAPGCSMDMLAALRTGDIAAAEAIRTRFETLEQLRNAHGPIPVLHHAVAEAGIAAAGPLLPLLDVLSQDLVDIIRPVARRLLQEETRRAAIPAAGAAAHG
ncbi:MAG TPA: dihydrodipicolinate synthase family protein [Verrucomicrobiales bacterium]|nr:dihydrodipicolinate synthase family protein [Verrucomicrobiales bacterium]